jgi:hypothetical protein
MRERGQHRRHRGKRPDPDVQPEAMTGRQRLHAGGAAFSVGERVRFTQPFSEKRIANGETGTVTDIHRGTVRVRLDSEKGEGKGRRVGFALKDHGHLEYGYATTSYSSRSRTAQWMPFVVDTDRAAPT